MPASIHAAIIPQATNDFVVRRASLGIGGTCDLPSLSSYPPDYLVDRNGLFGNDVVGPVELGPTKRPGESGNGRKLGLLQLPFALDGCRKGSSHGGCRVSLLRRRDTSSNRHRGV